MHRPTLQHIVEVLTEGVEVTIGVCERPGLPSAAAKSTHNDPGHHKHAHSHSGVLHRSIAVLELLLVNLRQLRALADEHTGRCRSARFIATIASELPDDYFPTVEDHLRRLRFPNGVSMTARFGQGAGYVLRSRPR